MSTTTFTTRAFSTISLGMLFLMLFVFRTDSEAQHVFAPVNESKTARYGHTTTLLQDGRVLIAGGVVTDFPQTYAEIYDPVIGEYSPIDQFIPRIGHTATLLPNGHVLIAGGHDGAVPVAETQIFVPGYTGTFFDGPRTYDRGAGHTATALSNGDVLLVGGQDLGPGSVSTAVIYDWETQTLIPVPGSLSQGRAFHTATALPGDRVLIHGGLLEAAARSGTLASAEMYDHATGTFTPVSSAGVARFSHTATYTLGKIVIAGGSTDTGSLAPIEVYDPVLDTWTVSTTFNRPRQHHTATEIAPGRVLFVGGQDDAGKIAESEIFDLADGSVAPTGSLSVARSHHSATQLLTGNIAVFGGSGNSHALKLMEQYTFVPTPTALSLELGGGHFVGETLAVTAELEWLGPRSVTGRIPNAPVTMNLTYDPSIPGNPPPSTVETTTDARGFAVATFVLSGRGAHTISATFTSDEAYNASSASARLTVYQRTALLANDAYGSATDPTNVSAILTAVPGNTPIALANIDFDFGGVVASGTASTNENGVATVTRTFVNPGNYGVTASFYSPSNYYADQYGRVIPTTSTATVTNALIATALSDFPAVVPQVVGESLTVRTVLSRLTAPAGVLPERIVTFTLDGVQSVEIVTSADGSAEATFAVTSRGTHTVTASYAGDTALMGSSTSTNFIARQRVLLTATQSVQAVAGVPSTVSATLLFVPGGAANSQTVSFSIPGGSPSSTSAITNGGGVATASVTFPTSGTFAVTASFAADAGDFLNSNGVNAPEVSSASAVVAKAQASLSAVTVSGTAFVGEPLTLRTVLTRVTSPGQGPIAGTVTFTVSPTGGGPSQTFNATAAADGVASAQFTPSARGQFAVTARFDGDSGHNAASASTNVTVYQKTRLTAAIADAPVAGHSATVTATLVAIPSNTPISEGSVSFTTSVGGVGPSTVQVGASGIATTSFVFPYAQTVSLTAIAILPAGSFLADRNGSLVGDLDANSLAAVNVLAQVSALSALSSPATAVVGAPFTMSTILTGHGGTPKVGAAISFRVTRPGGGLVELAAFTTQNGAASVAFAPTERGIHTVEAFFAGNAASPATSSNVATVPVYQRVSLTLSAPPAALAGDVVPFTATLITVPGGAGVSGETVAFTLANQQGTPAHQATLTTNGNGVGTVSVTVASGGSFTGHASFQNAADFYADSTGAFPVVAATGTTSIAIELPNHAPTFTSVAAIVAEAETANGRIVTFTATGQDTEQGTIAALCTPSSGSNFPLGITTVACTVTDAAGESDNGSFTVTVRDTTAPAITVPVTAAFGTNTGATYVGAFGAATAIDIVSSSAGITIAHNAPAAFPIGTTAIVWTAIDQAGNVSTATQSVTVADDDAPVLTVPANVIAAATGPAGSAVSFAVSAVDAADSTTPVTCSPNSGSVFPIGITTVTCSASDDAGNIASGRFTVTVSEVSVPGEMHGSGFVRDDDAKYFLEFVARERASGERARFSLRIDDDGRKKNKKKGKNDRDDRFQSRTVTFVRFSDDPTIRPGRKARPQVDSVHFGGTGEWNGIAGYRYEVLAQDAGEPGRHRETIQVTVWSPSNVVMASFEGELDGGNIQSVRIRH